MNTEKRTRKIESEIKKIKETIGPKSQSQGEIDWNFIIKGKFLCGFSDDSQLQAEKYAERLERISALDNYNMMEERPFKETDGVLWRYCAIVRQPGIKQPWFGGKCPVSSDTYVAVYLRDGGTEISKVFVIPNDWWYHNGSDYDIVAFIEL